MIKVITCGKAIATYPAKDWADAMRHALQLSAQNGEIPVYTQEGNTRHVFRGGRNLY